MHLSTDSHRKDRYLNYQTLRLAGLLLKYWELRSIEDEKVPEDYSRRSLSFPYLKRLVHMVYFHEREILVIQVRHHTKMTYNAPTPRVIFFCIV